MKKSKLKGAYMRKPNLSGARVNKKTLVVTCAYEKLEMNGKTYNINSSLTNYANTN